MIDKNHNAWGNIWTNDQILKYDPASSKWTIFDLPVRGTGFRHISLDERDGVTQVILPVYRTNQMGVMTLRSDADSPRSRRRRPVKASRRRRGRRSESVAGGLVLRTGAVRPPL